MSMCNGLSFFDSEQEIKTVLFYIRLLTLTQIFHFLFHQFILFNHLITVIFQGCMKNINKVKRQRWTNDRDDKNVKEYMNAHKKTKANQKVRLFWLMACQPLIDIQCYILYIYIYIYNDF